MKMKKGKGKREEGRGFLGGIVRGFLAAALCAVGFAAFAETDAVQLWEDGPYFATSNLGTSEVTEHPEYGALYKFDDADSAVKSILGEEWRVPSTNDFAKLLDTSYCTKAWDSTKEGYTFTGATDGYEDKSIFLPATGYNVHSGRDFAGEGGYYWSSTADDSLNAWGLTFTSNDASVQSVDRLLGFSVRAVRDTPPPPQEPVEYLDWDDVNKEMTNAVCTAYTVVNADTVTFAAGTTYVVLGNVTNTAKRITVNGTVANPTRLILCDGAELVAKKGIEVKVNGATTNALTICGQEGGTGALEALFDSAMAAGIGGGGYDVAGGIVMINGGTVTATGGDAATGIGGGTEGAGGIVTINGGSVTATGWTGFGAGRSAGTLDPGTVTFGEGVLFSVVTGKTAAVTAPIAQEDYEKDHSAAYVHIAPAKQEVSAVSAEGFLDLTVGDRVAEAEEPIVADPKWGNGKKAFVKIDGEDPAREYPELSIDKWFTSALTAGRYGMTFTSGETNETAVFWKIGEGWEVLDLPPYSTAGIEFQADKTYLALGQYEFAGTAPLTVLDGAKFEYGTGACFKGGKLEAPRRYGKLDLGDGFYQIVEKIKGCADNPWEVGVGVEAYTNGTDNLVIVGAGTIADLSEIPADVKRGIAAITIGDGVTDAAAGVFFGFDKVAVTLPDNWKGELPDDHGNWRGATGATLMAYPTAVKNVKVQQRYPWNGKVDVDFDLTGEGAVKVSLSARVDGKKIKNPTVTGETTFDLGKGKELKDLRLTWDAAADFGDAEKHEKIKVKLTVEKAD